MVAEMPTQGAVIQTSIPPMKYPRFRYRPLEYANEEDIRLVCLLPGSFRDRLQCEIFHASFEFEIEYEAVSYTWATETGDASLSQRIDCVYAGESETTSLWVTANCASALRRLRHISQARILWIDIIAIDQSNFEERNYQVELMAKIYSQASQVLIYLGEEDLGFGSRSIWQDQAKRTAALKKLFAKRWASRVWVIQEVALAQKLMMITGSVATHMDIDFMTRVRGRAKAAGLHVPGPLAWDPIISAPTRDLLSMLHMSRNCLSTDPRDKVYGLLGLTGERLQSLITVDYTQSIEEVLIHTARAIILFREDLDILAYASTSRGARHANGKLPTWVPDWTEHYDDAVVTPQFIGRKVGPWRSLSKEWIMRRGTSEHVPDWREVVHMDSTWTTNPFRMPYIKVRAHCIGIIDDTIQDVNCPSLQGQCAGVFRQQLMELLWQDVATHSWPPQYRWLVEGAPAQRDGSEQEAKPATPGSLTSFEKADLSSFCGELARLGEKKYVLRAGHLPALASAGFELGDSVYAIDGCTTPLILRPQGDGNQSRFRIVGSAYLLSLAHLDCWVTSGTGLKQQWDFDPFRQMGAEGTQSIVIY